MLKLYSAEYVDMTESMVWIVISIRIIKTRTEWTLHEASRRKVENGCKLLVGIPKGSE